MGDYEDREIPVGEGPRVEFKQQPYGLEKEVVAFANHEGGKIYIGVDDQGSVVHLEITNRLRSEIVNSLKNCEPFPPFELEEKEGYMILTIPSGPDKPYRAPTGFYRRIGASSQKLSRDEILELAIQENRVHFDSQIFATLPSLEDETFFDRNAFRHFRSLSGISTTLSDEQLLRNLRLIKKTESGVAITNALILLFAPAPEEIFPQCRLVMFAMKGPSEIIDQRIIQGNLFTQLSEGMKYFAEHLDTRFEISALKRTEIPELPEFVLRELCLNALIHRDYFETGAEVQIKIFPTFIEFANPGSPVQGYEPSELIGRSIRRNPIVADVFQRVGFIEKAGTGLLRVQEYFSSDHPTALGLKRQAMFFVAELKRTTKAAVDAPKFSSEKEAEIFKYLQNHGPQPIRKLSDSFGLSRRQIQNYIASLKELGFVEPLREGRSIRYRVSASVVGQLKN